MSDSFFFSPGTHLVADEGSSIALKSDSGGILPTLTRPSWLDELRLCVRYDLPGRIVLPTGITCIVEFDRVVSTSWNVAGSSGSQAGRIVSLPAFNRSGMGVFVVDGHEREMVVAPFLDQEFRDSVDLLAPFRFEGSRCSCAKSVQFGYSDKPVGHFFYGVGSKRAVTINGVSNANMLLNTGDSHVISFDRLEVNEDVVISSSPRMDSASVVARIESGDFSVNQALAVGKRMWYGIEGVPYSGGAVRVRSSPMFGEKWSSGFGSPPPASVSVVAPQAGDYCIMNLAGMHSWCCSTFEVKSKLVSIGDSYPTVCSRLCKFNGSKWLPDVDVSRVDLSARMSQSAQQGSKLCLIEPGIMDGSLRSGNQLVSFCRDFANRFSQAGLVSFVGVMSDGLSDDNIDQLSGNLELAAVNTLPGSSLAVFVSPDAGELCFAAIREIASSHRRNVYALVLHADSLANADKFGINLLIPQDLSPMVSVQAGRQVTVFDANALSRTN